MLSDPVYQGLKVGSKRKRESSPDDISRGAARAHQFLKEFSDLPLEKMDLKEALQQVSKLKNDLEKDAVNCHWLQQFFQLSLIGGNFIDVLFCVDIYTAHHYRVVHMDTCEVGIQWSQPSVEGTFLPNSQFCCLSGSFKWDKLQSSILASIDPLFSFWAGGGVGPWLVPLVCSIQP